LISQKKELIQLSAVIETLIFMAIAGTLWYIAQVKNLFGLGSRNNSAKDAFLSTLVFVVIAGGLYYIWSIY